MGRLAALLYGLVAYVVFLVSFLYAIGFVGNLFVPKTIDSGPEAPLSAALLVNMLLLGAFAIQHSVMARPGFKKHWTKIIPEAIERSTYVLLASLLLILLFWQWRAMPNEVWNVENQFGSLVLQALFWLGWVLVLASTYIIDHFDLFGLRQVFIHFRGSEKSAPEFKEVGFYKFVRHPLLLGFIIAFWATPRMSVGHLLFAAVTTVYMLIAIQLEERDLEASLGEDYAEYRGRVSMIIPWRSR